MSRKYKRKGWEEKREEVNQVVEEMDKAIEGHFTSPEQMKEYLSFMSRFYQYSPRNTSLIQSQFSGAKAVGSFKSWRDKGFSVNKGEKGIKILVPNKTTPKFKDENGKWKSLRFANESQKEKIKGGELEQDRGKLYFRLGHVFDVSQTNAKAEDLPEIFPNRWMEGDVDRYETVMDSLSDIASDMDVSVGKPFHELGSAKGAYYHSVEASNNGHIGLNPRNSELQNVKTMIHELAHAKLHHSNHENHLGLSDAEKEFQAEMVAYSTASYFGIDTSDYSLGYLANWTKGRELSDKEKLLREVKDTSVVFIEKVEKDLVFEKELEDELVNFSVNEYENVEDAVREDFRKERSSGKHPIAYTTLGDDEELEINTVLYTNENKIVKHIYGNVIDEGEVIQFEDKEEMLEYVKSMHFDNLVRLDEYDLDELIEKDHKLSEDLGLTKEVKEISNRSVMTIENKNVLER